MKIMFKNMLRFNQVNCDLWSVDKGKRIVLYIKDVQQLTGKGENTSRTILQKIRLLKAKTKEQFVSIEDFAEFTGISLDLIKQHLSN